MKWRREGSHIIHVSLIALCKLRHCNRISANCFPRKLPVFLVRGRPLHGGNTEASGELVCLERMCGIIVAIRRPSSCYHIEIVTYGQPY